MLAFTSSGAAARRHSPAFDLEETREPALRARKTLLLAFDSSAAARCALDHAIALARADGLSIHVVNVQSTPRDEPVFQEAGREEGNRILDVARARLDEEGIRHSSEVRFGDAAEEIVLCAARTRCSLIVIGTRSRGAFARFFSASVSGVVARLSPVPVAVVRHSVTSFVHAPFTLGRRRNAA